MGGRHSPFLSAGLRILAGLLGFALIADAADRPALKPTFHANLAAASEAAAMDQSLVLLIFGADWCAPCQVLKKQTLASAEFRDGAGALRIAEVDVDADEKTPQAFAVRSIPVLVLLTADGKIVARHTGLLDTAALLKWIAEGRERVRQGQWEGTAPGGQLAEFTAKATADGLDTNDLTRLVALLGQSDPAERASAAKLLLSQRERAMPSLIEAANDRYLGVRIAASELLQKLAPDSVAPDPWQSPEELRETIDRLRKWWAETGKLPPPGQPRVLDPTLQSSIHSALEALRGNDPVERTEAMSTLANHGTAALPAMREAIKRSESKGDHRTIALLEDVRWSVLIPDAVERRTAGARAALARGASSERQAAATRLGRAGREAIPALSELVNDSDALVAENAVRALSSIGGRDAIPAMAALLEAADSNLRMTAAQALGKTRNDEAAKHLLRVLNDPNEIVACTALAALEEVHSQETYSSSKEVTSPDIVAALKKTLDDSRWRVRATAAEVAGKLHARELAPDLQKLLDDADGFVVKNTLVALRNLSAAPDAQRLAELAKRLPGLRGDAVEMMMASGSDEIVQTVVAMFETGSVDDQLTILSALSRNDAGSNQRDPWKALLTKASGASDVRVRRAAAEALAMRPLKAAAELVAPLLADEDSETRAAAADVVMGIIAGKRRMSSRMGMAMQYVVEEGTFPGQSSSSKESQTNMSYTTPEQLATWHATLSKHAGYSPESWIASPLSHSLDPRVAMALFATGDGKAELPILVAALDRLDKRSIKKLADSPAGAVMVRKLPWPEGKPVVEKLCNLPSLFALAVTESDQAAPEIAAHLLEPMRFKAAVEQAKAEELTTTLQLLLGSSDIYSKERRKWSLLAPNEDAARVASALLDSTNAAWRAASVYAMGRRDAEKHVAVFEKALKDENAWVRAAGAQGFSRATKERAALEERLGPLLSDTNLHVARTAMVGLLEPETREAAGWQWSFDYFMFESVTIPGQAMYVSGSKEDRPLTTLEGKPAFLAETRRRMESSKPEEAAGFMLLLAQYGQFDGVERLARLLPEQSRGNPERFEESSLTDAILTGIALSRDAKHVPLLRNQMQGMKNEYEFKKILKALRGMTGPEARQLRLEINKRMRQGTSQSNYE